MRWLHDFAFGMGWSPWPILAKKRWPAIRFRDKRAVTPDEHSAVVTMEHNPERGAGGAVCRVAQRVAFNLA